MKNKTTKQTNSLEVKERLHKLARWSDTIHACIANGMPEFSQGDLISLQDKLEVIEAILGVKMYETDGYSVTLE
jgi:hypothetical protein